LSKLFHPILRFNTTDCAYPSRGKTNSVPVAIGSRRIFAVPLNLAYRNLADADV
jgi:hypothetical protein